MNDALLTFADYTTQEYFERKRAIRFPDAHGSIMKACIIYLSFDISIPARSLP